METRRFDAPCPVCASAVSGWAFACPRCGYHPDRYNRALDDVALIFRLSCSVGGAATAAAAAPPPSRVLSLLRRIVGRTAPVNVGPLHQTNPPPEVSPGAGAMH
jgi:hypothetical protein